MTNEGEAMSEVHYEYGSRCTGNGYVYAVGPENEARDFTDMLNAEGNCGGHEVVRRTAWELDPASASPDGQR